MKRSLLVLFFAGVICMFGITQAKAFTYSDSFEGSSFDPFWTVYDSSNLSNQNGTASLSTDLAHTGSQSFKAASLTGNLYSTAKLEHQFDQLMQGTASVWLYDGYPGSSHATYALLNMWAPGLGGEVGVFDNVGNQYMSLTSGGWQYSNIARTLGWHKLAMNVSDTGTIYTVDGTVAYSDPSLKSFKTVDVFTWTLPNYDAKTYYFDDFNINCTVTPEPASMLLFSLGGAAMAFRRFCHKKA